MAIQRVIFPDLLKTQIRNHPATINQHTKTQKSGQSRINQQFFDPSTSAIILSTRFRRRGADPAS